MKACYFGETSEFTPRRRIFGLAEAEDGTIVADDADRIRLCFRNYMSSYTYPLPCTLVVELVITSGSIANGTVSYIGEAVA